jgi:hypothetical protein
MRAALLLLLVARVAAADGDVHVSGFVTAGGGELTGTVTDLDGKPLGGVTVRIAPAAGKERTTKTNAKGVYKVQLPDDGPTYVYVESAAKILGQLSTAVREGDVEAITMRETLPPAIVPKAKIPLDTVLEYSELAQDKNEWTRAWLLLDVDDTGKVRRVKLLNKPGLDLDAIAIRAAFTIPFEPARDRTDHPVPALVVWTWEWPAFLWMISNRKHPGRLPPNVSTMHCKNSGPEKAIRDCSKPALAKGITAPWIDKPPSR